MVDVKNNLRSMKIVLITVLLIIVLILLYFVGMVLFDNSKRFDVDNVLLKLSIKEGDSLSKALKITSYVEGDFKIKKDNLDFVSVSEEEFKLGKNEEKDIVLNFNVNGKGAGIYFGNLIISNVDDLIIPIILEVETKEVLFDGIISVSSAYSSLHPGENIEIENKIFNLENIGMKNVEIDYFIKSFDGKIIFSDKENINVETQILNTKVVPISNNVDGGDYLFVSIIKYKDSVGTSSHFFRIHKKGFHDIKSGFFMWVIIFLLIGLIFFIIYYTQRRDKVLLELQRQYKNEIKTHSIAMVKEKEAATKLSPEKRKKVLNKICGRHSNKVRTLGKIYRHRVKIVKKLQKKKKLSEVDKKLTQWKKSGYNVSEILVKPEKKIGFKEKIRGYKEEGYDL